MALPRMETRTTHILTLLPADTEASRIYRALVGVTIEADVYRTARPGVWQFETYMAPHLVRRAIERAGMNVLSIEPDDDTPDTLHYVRFAPEPYCGDTDWPAAPYQGVNPWHAIDWPRAPKALRTDAVAGPGGVVLCNLDTTPAALIPMPGCAGLDYTYADMGMAEAAPVVEPTPPAPEPTPKKARKFVSFGEGNRDGMHVYGPMPVELVKALSFVAEVKISNEICEQYTGPAYFVKWADGENWVHVGSRLHAALYPYTGMAMYEKRRAA